MPSLTLPLMPPPPLERVEEAAGSKKVLAAAWCLRSLSYRRRSRRARLDYIERSGRAARH